MSMVPAKSASIAEGPALKPFHSIFTPGPMAFSNHPLLFPTIACGCVTFGNAPTRITVWPQVTLPTIKTHAKAIPTTRPNLVMSRLSPGYRHRQYACVQLFLLSIFRLPFRRSARHQIRQGRALQNLGGSVPD